MTQPLPTVPCVLVIGDAEPIVELVGALSEPLPTTIVSKIEVVASSGGDEAVELFEARRPHVVVVTASLETGDAAALIEAVREILPPAQVGVVVIGDPEGGPIRNAGDASELVPDRFVPRPILPRLLRFAVASALETAILARSGSPDAVPVVPEAPVAAEAPAEAPAEAAAHGEAEAAAPAEAEAPAEDVAPEAEAPSEAAAPPPVPQALPTADSTRETLRRRWEALADSIVDATDDEDAPAEAAAPAEEAAPLPPPIATRPRHAPQGSDAVALPQAWSPGTTSSLPEAPWGSASAEAPVREPTLIIRDPSEVEPAEPSPPISRTRTGDEEVDLSERAAAGTPWSEPMPLAALIDRDAAREPRPAGPGEARPADPAPRPASEAAGAVRVGEGVGLGPGVQLETGRRPRVRLPDLDGDPASALVRPPVRDDLELPLDDLILGGSPRGVEPRLEVLEAVPDAAPPAPSSTADGRDFARQLRAKMSQMAQRLFQGADAPAPAPADLAPRHDHSTEFDLSALGEEPPLVAVTEIEARASARASIPPELVTSPGSWDSQVRERGLPDQGEIVRGVSDAPMLLAKMFAGGSTGRIAFRRGEVETVVFFDQGRPVFASSSETRDRMGELLVREGKITASQYERCQSVVAESGRRMGEILVDFGYLKRRELLPAVRRHVEDIVYALFGWDGGRYHIAIEAQPSAERIRLSRHPAALILEGIRRKLNRTTLERLLGPPSTVIEVADRERLGGIINMGDLSSEERAVLAAFDGQTDLAQAARAAGVDVADVLPLAWGLCVLGLATARRTDTEVHDEGVALVGETDLAIDRERVRARWQLVAEADYFALLGVRRDATAFEIRRAYQAARRDFAADGFPSDLRRELAQELDDIANVLDEAYRVLRDDRLRQTYLANLIE